MRCTNCGEDVARPVWAIYGDEAFDGKQQAPFPLHPKCFNANERVTVGEWRDRDGEPELVEFEATRYLKAEAPNG